VVRDPVVVFPFAVSDPFARLSRLWGVQPDRARLELRGRRLTAFFGPWCVDTTLDNVRSLAVTGPYAWLKVWGPPRLSLADGGLTFATNAQEGLCICFHVEVPGLLPFRMPRHGSLTVTVENPHDVRGVLERTLRAVEQAPGPATAAERLERSEHDAIEGMSTAELRDRAAALGIENPNTMSYQELVDSMERPARQED
jgi:hypothetical protein